jgi:lipoprotein-anchoring transpeptidase ErfK/SrfK
MRLIRLFLTALLALSLSVSAALSAAVTITIDLSDQEMTVSAGGLKYYRWPVSTARPGYRTPTGVFHPIRLERVWYSTKYDYAPMPYSIFFYGGYAIHGTTDTAHLGKPVSHGCVRLHPDNAKRLFELVRQHAYRDTDIVIRR